MGGASVEREAQQARTAYVSAAVRLMKAMEELGRTKPTLLADDWNAPLPPWTEEQRDAMTACADGFAQVMKTRRAYLRLWRESRRPTA